MKGKEFVSSNTQSCVASTSDEDDILYNEVTTIAGGRKRFFEGWLIDSAVTWHMTSHREQFHQYEPI